MGQYKNIGGGSVVSPFFADGLREIQPGEIVNLPDEQADGSPLYWSPEHFGRQDGQNPIHALYADAPVEHPNVVTPPEPTPPKTRAGQEQGKTNLVRHDGGEKE